MASEKTLIKLCLKQFTQSVFSLSLPLLSLVSSYLTVEEAAMRSPYIVQTPFFDASVLNNGRNGNGDSSEGFRLFASSPSNSPEESQVPPVTIPVGDGKRIPLTTWRDSLLSILVHLIEEEPFTVKIKAKAIHKTTILGISPTYDLTFCNSDYFFITKELLEKSLKEMGMRTGNGGMMLHSFRWAFSYLYNLSTRDGLMGEFTTVSEKNLEQKPNTSSKNTKKKNRKVSPLSTPSNESSENDDGADSDGDENRINTKHYEDPLSIEPEEPFLKREQMLKKLFRNKKVFRRLFIPSESFSSDDEEENFYLNPVTLDNIQSASTDTHFIDERRLVDSYIDRSLLVVCGCINILQSISGVLNNLSLITPERPYKPTKNQNNEPFVSKESEKYLTKIFNQKIEEFPSSDLKFRNDVHTIIQDKNEKQYNVYAYAKEISDVIGVWGNDDQFLKFLGDLRQGTGGSGSELVGFQKIKERLEPQNQGNFGSYLTSEKSSSSSSSSSSFTTTTTTTATTPVTSTESQTQNQERIFIDAAWDKEVQMMKEERNMYQDSVEYGISIVFKCISDFMTSVDTRYKNLLERRTFLAGTTKRRAFYEKTKARDFVNNVAAENKEEASRLYDGSLKLKSIVTHVYKGSKYYKDLAEFYKVLIDHFINIMNTEGYLPFYHPQTEPTSTSNEKTFFTLHFADYYQMRDKITPEEFCQRLSSQPPDENDFSIYNTLSENDMQDMFSYKIIKIKQMDYPVLCIFGIPEAILYNEMATLKWLATAWKHKTKTECKEFENQQNRLKGFSIMGLCSKLWRAKSYVAMHEYEICHANFQERFLVSRILKNVVPSHKRGGSGTTKTDSEYVTMNEENKDEEVIEGDQHESQEDDEQSNEGDNDEQLLSNTFGNFNILE